MSTKLFNIYTLLSLDYFGVFSFQVRDSKEVRTHTAQFDSFGQVHCDLPYDEETNQIVYKVSVSRNGENYGQHQEMLVYDGSCLECDQRGCEVLVSVL